MPTADPAEKLNVVILYQHLAYMNRAMATYLRLERELAGDITPAFRVWRLDIALEPAFADEAEQDIAAAEVLILAVNGRQPCPPAFQRWKGSPDPAGGAPARAIIALIEAPDESAPAAESWSGVLHAAEEVHSEVFVSDMPPPQPSPGFSHEHLP